jgi:serine/threonine-protein kinase
MSATTCHGDWLTMAWQIIAAAAVLVAAIVVFNSYLTAGGAASGVVPPLKFKAPTPAADPPTNGSILVAGPAATDLSPFPAVATSTPGGERRGLAGSPPDGDATQHIAASPAAFSGAIGADALASDAAALSLTTVESGFGVGPPAVVGGVELPLLDADPAASSVSPAANVKPKHLVVAARPPATPEPETEYVTSLHEACRRATALGLTDIELGFSGPLLQTSCDVALPRLTLRAAANCKPILVFQPPVTERQMIRLTGGAFSRLSIQGVELRLELPREPADGWALFALGSGQTLELSSCVLTVQDGDSEHPPIHDQVAMIAVQPRRAGENMVLMDPQPAMAQSATILLDRCIARGEATLVWMTDETPLSLHWSQGLLATSRRLIETGGSATDPKWFEKIDIELDALTASCKQGLYQMRRGPNKNHQFAVHVVAKHCILISEADTPLYEYVGVSALAQDDLESDGDYNRYPPSPDVIFLRIRSGVPGEVVQTFGLDRCQWSTENHSQIGIPWLHTPPQDVPAHALTKTDFATDATLPVGAGFDPAQLPNAAPALPIPSLPSAAETSHPAANAHPQP